VTEMPGDPAAWNDFWSEELKPSSRTAR
jgi:hypothetical protein